MSVTPAGKIISIAVLLAALAFMSLGCAGMQAGKGTYTSDRDAQAVHEMEWNLSPWR